MFGQGCRSHLVRFQVIPDGISIADSSIPRPSQINQRRGIDNDHMLASVDSLKQAHQVKFNSKRLSK